METSTPSVAHLAYPPLPSWMVGEVDQPARPAAGPDGCPVCRSPLAEHVGGLPCVQGEPSRAGGWHNLPMAGAMWAADGGDIGS